MYITDSRGDGEIGESDGFPFTFGDDHMILLFVAQLFGRRRTDETLPKCRVGVKVFGNELSVFTCEDLYDQLNQLSLSVAGLAVKLLKVY